MQNNLNVRISKQEGNLRTEKVSYRQHVQSFSVPIRDDVQWELLQNKTKEHIVDSAKPSDKNQFQN